MRIFSIGDVMGKPGRQVLEHFLPKIREELKPDFIMLNGENAAGGFGITKKIFDHFVSDLAIDCVTMGNHWQDKREIFDFIDHPKLVLPGNMQGVDASKYGVNIIELKNGTRVAVMNLIGKIFMKGENSCPLTAADKFVADRIPESVKIRILDVHAEATSEKQALGRLLDGRFSVVYGTHSHVPTADERILKGGTAFVTDLGMTGPYDSVIGIRTEAAIHRMKTGEKKKFEPAAEDLWLCALLTDIDEVSGKCTNLQRIRWQKQA